MVVRRGPEVALVPTVFQAHRELVVNLERALRHVGKRRLTDHFSELAIQQEACHQVTPVPMANLLAPTALKMSRSETRHHLHHQTTAIPARTTSVSVAPSSSMSRRKVSISHLP